MPDSVYDVILLIGSSKNPGKRPPPTRSNKLPNLSAMFASQKSSNSICNWTRRERWKPIARRSSYRSKSRAEDQINAYSCCEAKAPSGKANLLQAAQLSSCSPLRTF